MKCTICEKLQFLISHCTSRTQVLDWPASIITPDNVLAAGHYTLDLRTCARFTGCNALALHNTKKSRANRCKYDLVSKHEHAICVVVSIEFPPVDFILTPCFSPASSCNIERLIWTICSLGYIYNTSLAHNYCLETLKSGQRKESPHFEMELFWNGTFTLGSFHSLKFVWLFFFFFWVMGQSKWFIAKKIDIGKHPSN